MSQFSEQYTGPVPVAALGTEARAQFLRRTYLHVFGAILAFAGIEAALFTSGLADVMARVMLSGSWLLLLGGFILAAWLFTSIAERAVSPAAQYAALGAYVLAEAIIFVPLLWIADQVAPGAIFNAAVVSLLVFSGITAYVVTSRKDFTFLGGALCLVGILALVLIVCGAVFGLQLGVWFSVAMIGYAGATILFKTSDVMRNYPEDRYVAAALALFAAVALLFWYVLRLFIALNQD